MWIILSIIYAITNAFYTNYNDKRRYNGYILGMWRGYGVSLCIMPLILTIPWDIPLSYLIILIIQGLLIGIYDSHIFFASGKYGSHASFGFMTTCVLITVCLWWAIHIEDFRKLLQNPPYFITLMALLSGYTISYWQMMRVKVSKKAEQYLYPAVFALALMSIATHYIAIHGGSMYNGIVYYLTIACFVSGIYNHIMYIKTKKKQASYRHPNIKDGIILITLSTILIAAKTAAMRLCINPGYVVAVLLTSPLMVEIIKYHQLNITPSLICTLLFLSSLLIFVS